MPYESLSRSTRVARASFLVVGTSSIVTDFFNVPLDSIQVLNISFPEHTMSTVLVIATVYLFAAFLIALKEEMLYQTVPEALKPIIEHLEKERKEFVIMLEFANEESISQQQVRAIQNAHKLILKKINYFDKLTQVLNEVVPLRWTAWQRS